MKTQANFSIINTELGDAINLIPKRRFNNIKSKPVIIDEHFLMHLIDTLGDLDVENTVNLYNETSSDLGNNNSEMNEVKLEFMFLLHHLINLYKFKIELI